MGNFKSRFKKSKEFKLNLFDRKDLFQDNSGAYRTYRTPEGESYPSITSVLSANPEKKIILDEWRDRVGIEDALKISTKASTNGNHVHDSLEQYVLGNTPSTPSLQYKAIKKVIDEHVDNIRGVEIPLYSRTIKIAGTADLVAEYDGDLAVIDYKTSLRWKREDWITDYFIQSTFYALSVKEIYGVLPKYIVIIIGVEDSPKAQVFKKKTVDYITNLVESKKLFNEINYKGET